MLEIATDTAAVETPVVDTPTDAVVETPVESTEAAETPEVEGGEEQASEAGPVDDGAQITGTSDPAVRAAIDALKQSNPAAARKIRDMAGVIGALTKEFPGGLSDVRSLKQTVEQYGGAEGLQSLAKDRETLNNFDSRFEAGDATLLSDLEQQFPGAMAKILPDAIGNFAKADPEAYSHYMSGVISATLDRPQQILGGQSITGMLQAVAQSLGNIKDSEGNVVSSQEIDALKAIIGAADGFREMAAKAPEKKVDPERQKFEEEKKAFESRKQSEAAQKTLGEMNAYASSATNKALLADLQSRKSVLTAQDEEFGIMRDEVVNKAVALMNANPEIAKKLKSLEAARESSNLVSYVNSQFDAYLPKAIEFVMRRYEKFSGGSKKPAAPVKAAPTGPQTIKEAPAQDRIDWSRTTRAMAMNGKAYLKGEKNLYVWM